MEVQEEEESEDEPKGRWIWTPLTRSFLVYLGTGMLGDGCQDRNAIMGMCMRKLKW